MKQLLQQYATYNVWANELLTAAILKLDEKLHHQKVASSFPGLLATVLHMWDAESIWWQRLMHHEKIIVPGADFSQGMKEAVDGLLQQNKQWEAWVNYKTETELAQNLKYKRLKGDPFEQPVHQVLLHVFNHGTYHRGQLVTIMRALGVEKIPQTDFIVWGRSV